MNEKEKRKIIEEEKLYFEQEEPVKKRKSKTVLIVLVFILFIGAYSEKKIIRLSTLVNETLLFILNSFKKHQEIKKNNAKKLIKGSEDLILAK